MRFVVVLALALTAVICVSVASADEQPTPGTPTAVPPGAKWHEEYIDEADGTQLHVDVLRPAQLPDSARTPVLLSIGPYFNHTGQTGVTSPVEDAPWDPAANAGPSTRFYDFETGSNMFAKGYTYVMVDLRGFGGSSGCLDWAGPGEQADVKAAVEWAASRPWSTGKVGMYGKSYDGVTGLIADNLQPKGLAAVVAQEPVYDLYRYLYMNRVRFINSLATPGLYDAIAGSPGSPGDTLAYNSNSINDTARPGCPVFNHADQQERDHEAAYWKPRDLIAKAGNAKSPLFMTQGFIENNTKPDGAFDYFNRVPAPKRAWFGMWDHVRGNDRDPEQNNRLKMGRAGWFDEVMRFFDHYVADKPLKDAPTDRDPVLAVQSSDGKWRAEDRWPPVDSFAVDTPLNGGTYVDQGQSSGTSEGTPPYDDGAWTFSPAFDHQVHMAGVPRVSVATESGPEANLVVNVYDLDATNKATLISRGAYLLDGSNKPVTYDLYGNDWIMPAGHRLGVRIVSSNGEWWQHVPTGQPVTVTKASIQMPYLGCARTQPIEGGRAVKLDDYLESAPFSLDAEFVKQGTKAGFPVPGPLAADCPKAKPAGGRAVTCAKKPKLRFRIHQPRPKGRIVRVVAYVNGKRVQTKKGRRVTRLVVKRPKKKKNFTVRIVATSSTGQRTISVRKYRRCKKTRPRTHIEK
ncbi:MAG TPA: CocE/NonD family hydrolase [Thermoleophilaceae bacterium]